jgi:hypothetical protein
MFLDGVPDIYKENEKMEDAIELDSLPVLACNI